VTGIRLGTYHVDSVLIALYRIHRFVTLRCKRLRHLEYGGITMLARAYQRRKRARWIWPAQSQHYIGPKPQLIRCRSFFVGVHRGQEVETLIESGPSLEPIYTRAQCRERKDVSEHERRESGDVSGISWKFQITRPAPSSLSTRS
jgi:hypothetical protein